MSLLIDITHIILAATLSFLGLGYEREDEARAIQISPEHALTVSGGAVLTQTSFAVRMQHAQAVSEPALVLLPSSAPQPPQMVIVNDCEALTSQRPLPTL